MIKRTQNPRLSMFVVAVILCALFVGNGKADNGAALVAHPVSGISIDGQFNDWPAQAVRYRIALPE